MEELPTDLQRGLDFQIVKTSKGGYADYSTSKWSRKESALTAEEQAAIDEHGLFNLSDFLPKQPTEADLKVIKEMFEASVDGQPYDPDCWGAYYKPYGLDTPNAAPKAESAEAPAPVTASSFVGDQEEDTPAPTAPVATPAVTPSSQKAEDILAMIRNRQKQ
jgi:homogentisate 1,2-dioxygenase